MPYRIEKYNSANSLPESWDDLCEDYFQFKRFLNHTDAFNPCNQRYYLLYYDEKLITGAVMYSIRLDLLTYLSVPSPIKMHVIGIPCSVSSSGMVGDPAKMDLLFDHLKQNEKGFILGLNLTTDHQLNHVISGKTLPTIIFRNTFTDWGHYLDSLHSRYRRRISRISESFENVRIQNIPCLQFTKEMHMQYLQVLRHSKGKLETLSFEFFQNLPTEFSLNTFSVKSTLLGWYITVKQDKKMYFFLGGIDYKLKHEHQTYLNLIYHIIKEGIEAKSESIDLGQTAEVPKLRTGATLSPKDMFAWHSSSLFRALLKAGRKALEYSTHINEAHVFKQ